jgi:hypothetical protein
MPRVLPCKSLLRPCCHWPARRALATASRLRVAAMISAQVNSGVACLHHADYLECLQALGDGGVIGREVVQETHLPNRVQH